MKPKLGQEWVNKKTKCTYVILYRGIDCTNSRSNTPVIIYQLKECTAEVFCRDESEFLEKFEPCASKWSFEELCELLPEDVYWGDPLTTSVVEEIAMAIESKCK